MGEVSACKGTKTFIVDLLVFLVYIGLNMAINLYNKWMFSVLKFEVPLANLAVHQMVGFLVLGTFAVFSSFCKIPCCQKCGLNGFMGCSKKEDCRGWAIVTALGV